MHMAHEVQSGSTANDKRYLNDGHDTAALMATFLELMKKTVTAEQPKVNDESLEVIAESSQKSNNAIAPTAFTTASSLMAETAVVATRKRKQK